MRRLFVLLFLFVGLSPVLALAATQDATVTWTSPTVNPSSVTGYLVERKTGTTGTFAQVGTTNATTMTFADVNLAQGTVFCYRITATGAVGNGPASPEGCSSTAGTPGAPGQPTVTITIRP